MADAMDGSAGNDAIHGLAGNDTLNGGAGGDTLEGGMGNDVLNGGGGTADYASYAGASGAVTVSLSVTTAQDTVNAGSDRLLNIEGLIGSVFADRLTGDNLTNVIRGGAGADTISGLAGNDLLQGEGGADVLVGGAGGDVLTGGAGNDRFIFNAPGEGVDTITDFESSATPGDTDVLQFARAAFGGLATGGILASQFQASLLPTASTADVRFLYASANFGLFYDADGSGGAFDPVMLAQIFAPVVAGDIQFI
jgi:Ca2+-binding RTX toxin-like protein